MTKRLLQAAIILILSLCPLRGRLAQTAHAQGGLVVAAGQVVTVSANTTVAGITVNAGGELRFDPSHSVTISTTQNAIISGTLTMRPSSPANVHTLRFIGITEANFVGGGLVPLATDVGLWVVGSGRLDILGTPKTAWTHAAGSIAQGATTITLISAPIGWQVGDTISIAPTEPITVAGSYGHFDLRTITAINGAVVTLSAPATYAHPITINPFDGSIYTAELLNLTRNTRIEGTGDGGPSYTTNHRAHIFIRSTVPQSIRYLEASHLGPRKAEDGYTGDILGRYGLHFHMAGDGSRGSLVEGVVVRDSGSHAFVPHASHGITFKDTISYNTFEESYWWDGPVCNCAGAEPDVNDTNDLLIDHAVAVFVRSDPTFRGYRLAGFALRRGNNLTLRNSVAVSVRGNTDASGFEWPEHGQAVWIFDGNLAHNNSRNGIFVWQNNTDRHVIANFVAYSNGGDGVDHGAYDNVYQYVDIDLFGNTSDFHSRAASDPAIRPDGYGQAIERLRTTGKFVIAEHNTVAAVPVLIKDCIIGSVVVGEAGKNKPGMYDFVNCVKPGGVALAPADFTVNFAWPASRYRVQNGGAAWQLTGDPYPYGTGFTVTTIAPFYLYLSPLAQQVKDIFDANPGVRQELINAGVIH